MSSLTAEDKMGRAWLIVLVAAIVAIVAAGAVIGTVIWGVLNLVGRL